METVTTIIAPYSFAFTALSLRLPDLKTALEAEMTGRDLRTLLHVRTESASKRMVHEMRKRIALMSEDQKNLQRHGLPEEQQHMALWTACKAYPLLYDFIREVVREKFLTRDLTLNYGDFQAFTQRQKAFHPELETISESTYHKARQVIFRMLVEGGLISGTRRHKSIMPPLYSERFLQSIASDPPAQRLSLLIEDQNLQTLVS